MTAGYIIPQSNFTATTDPTVDDDVTLGYSEGSPWVNTATRFVFVLVDPSAGAADWQQVYPAVLRVTTVTADVTLTEAHTVVLCDATSGPLTVTLPAVVVDRPYYIKKIDGTGNAVIIDGNASETIDGFPTKILAARYNAATIVSDGTEWHIL